MATSDRSGIGDRMKLNYEGAYKLALPRRLPTVIRLDGKAFHTWTRGFDRPFDSRFISWMADLTHYLCAEVQTTVLGYCQSDEISLLLHPYKRLESEPWFANELQKMVSVSAGLASARLTHLSGRVAVFDSRVFVLPEAEVVNYFIWRQQDAARNSLQMVAQSLYSHGELHGKKEADLHELLHRKGVNWNDIATHRRRGFCVVRRAEQWVTDEEIPLFTADRPYIERLLTPEA